MSTKIYNGYRIDGYGRDPFAFTEVLRARLDPVRDRADGALLAERMAESIDRMLLGLPRKKDPDTTAATRAHHRTVRVSMLGQSAAVEYMIKQSDLRRKGKTDSWDYDPNRFELSLASDPHSDAMLAITFCENSALQDTFETIAGVSEYRYWNNSDRPAYVTQKEWNRRRKAWDAILDWGEAPAEKMLTFKLRSDPHANGLDWHGPLSEHISAQLPSVHDRASLMAGELAYQRLAPHVNADNFSKALFIKRTEVTGSLEAVLPEIDDAFLDRPLADLYRLLGDDQLASVLAAVGHWFETHAAPELGLEA